jgi:hypothetical protein
MKPLFFFVAVAILACSCTKTEQHINTNVSVDSVYVDTAKIKTVFYKNAIASISVTTNKIDGTIYFYGELFAHMFLLNSGSYEGWVLSGYDQFTFKNDTLIALRESSYHGNVTYSFRGVK